LERQRQADQGVRRGAGQPAVFEGLAPGGEGRRPAAGGARGLASTGGTAEGRHAGFLFWKRSQPVPEVRRALRTRGRGGNSASGRSGLGRLGGGDATAARPGAADRPPGAVPEPAFGKEGLRAPRSSSAASGVGASAGGA